MPSSDKAVEIDVAFEDGLLARIDKLRQRPGCETRSDVVVAAIESTEE